VAASHPSLQDYRFVEMSEAWKSTWAQLESSFDGALASGKGRTVKDTDGTTIGLAVVAIPNPDHITPPSALYGLVDVQEERAAELEQPTFRLSIGGQGVLYVSDGDGAHWYWISDTELVAVTTDRRQDGGSFVTAYATHTL
jgi:hypothetical protein